MAKKVQQKPVNKVGIVIGVLAALFFITLIFSFIVGLFLPTAGSFAIGNVALIPIKGVIVSDGDSGLLGDNTVKSTSIVERIEQIREDESIKAVIFDINSPGGSAVASEEIANAIGTLEVPTVSFIRDTGASGAYWIAAATDHIFASRMSITGSVGVISSYLEFAGFLEDNNITYRRLVAGKYKDIGSPLKHMSREEEEIWQDSLDVIHTIFSDYVQERRNIPLKDIDDIATGRFYVGVEAKNVGLIDEFGGKSEAVAYVEDLIEEEVEIIEYVEQPGFFDLLAQSISKGFMQASLNANPSIVT